MGSVLEETCDSRLFNDNYAGSALRSNGGSCSGGGGGAGAGDGGGSTSPFTPAGSDFGSHPVLFTVPSLVHWSTPKVQLLGSATNPSSYVSTIRNKDFLASSSAAATGYVYPFTSSLLRDLLNESTEVDVFVQEEEHSGDRTARTGDDASILHYISPLAVSKLYTLWNLNISTKNSSPPELVSGISIYDDYFVLL
jgi:hypothetical protein